MDDELKPCPFCNGRADYQGGESRGYWVVCTHCGARGAWGDYAYQAKAEWNKRGTSRPVDARIEELALKLEKRAEAERIIAENSRVVADLLQPQIDLFEAGAPNMNLYAVRTALDHAKNAKTDIEFADLLDAAADALRGNGVSV